MTYVSPDGGTLISNVKDSIVCSVLWDGQSPSRGKSSVVIVSFFYRSEKSIEVSSKMHFEFVHEDCIVKDNYIR